MGDRLNIGREVRELKLGSTFSSQSTTGFHTIKYDFKPASVDLNRSASVEVGSNNQVTVTVPNLESAGVPNTVFKGNQRKYTKECLIIFDKKTGVVTLEKLNHNIQVKKTRSEPPPNKNTLPPQKLTENSTMRTQSKTKVSTGNRKNNMIGFTPRVQVQGSPMQQGSPSSYSSVLQRRSPQQAPAWNANNGQATLPSFPIITDDVDDIVPLGSTSADTHMNANTSSTSSGHNNSIDFHQQQPQFLHQQQQHQQQQQQQIHQHHLQPQSQYQNSSIHHNSNSNSSIGTSGMIASQSLANAAAALEKEIGVLSSSDSGSSSSSDTSDSGSDSDSDLENHQPNQNNHNNHQSHNNYPTNNSLLPAAVLLHDDLQLSESNSDDDDD